MLLSANEQAMVRRSSLLPRSAIFALMDRMARYSCGGAPIRTPEEIIPFLGGGEKHWRKGRSAYELAHSWMKADGIPTAVSAVLETQGALAKPILVEGHFERETKLPGRGKASQTDLLALCRSRGQAFTLGVEGKVDETFGPLVSEWDNGTPNRRLRLDGLVGLLGGDPRGIAGLRYQLLHRTAAALIEASHFQVNQAVMLVQSFDPGHAWFDDFRAFSDWLGIPCSRPGYLSGPKPANGSNLYIGWCADQPTP